MEDFTMGRELIIGARGRLTGEDWGAKKRGFIASLSS